MSEGKLYDVIYADPAWRYDFSKSDSRQIENQYPTMTVEEICALEIPAKPNAVLYMWATAPKLLEAIKVISAWGFEYKTQAVWDKQTMGMGYWFRGQHEILMVAVRGKFSPPEQPLRISSVIREKRGKHSKKPIYVRDMIAKWYPNADRLEMFARTSGENWDVWGNQVENSIAIKSAVGDFSKVFPQGTTIEAQNQALHKADVMCSCVECGRKMDEMEHNYGTDEMLCCIQCYNEAQGGSNYT